MQEELPALTTWQQIGLILAMPGYDSNGSPLLDEGDMADIARLLDRYKVERDAERDAAEAAYKLSEQVSYERLGEMHRLVDQRDALREALQSLVDGQDERDIEHYTRLTVDEARKIMDLAYNRK